MLLNVVTNSNLKIKEGEETVDMCKAIEDMRAESLEEGLEKGREEGREEGREKTLRQMSQNLFRLGVSISDIAKAAGKEETTVADWIASFV